MANQYAAVLNQEISKYLVIELSESPPLTNESRFSFPITEIRTEILIFIGPDSMPTRVLQQRVSDVLNALNSQSILCNHGTLSRKLHLCVYSKKCNPSSLEIQRGEAKKQRFCQSDKQLLLPTKQLLLPTKQLLLPTKQLLIPTKQLLLATKRDFIIPQVKRDQNSLRNGRSMAE